MCALSLPSAELRNDIVSRLREEEQVLVLGCGATSLRFRPALTVTAAELDRGVEALDRVVATLA
jgi:L-lysine 6-transaminase